MNEKIYLDFEVIYHNPNHIEMTSILEETIIPNSKLEIESITLLPNNLQDIDNCTFKWEIGNREFIQNFSIQTGVFCTDNAIVLTGRCPVQTLILDSMKCGNLFYKLPVIKLHTTKDNLIIIRSFKCKLCFTRIIGAGEWLADQLYLKNIYKGLGYYLPAYSSFLTTFTNSL